MRTKMMTVPCALIRGGFSDERVFRLATPDGRDHVGVVDSIHCWDKSGAIRGPKVTGEGAIDGRLAARVVARDGGLARIAIPPDDTVLVVPWEFLQEFPPGEENLKFY